MDTDERGQWNSGVLSGDDDRVQTLRPRISGLSLRGSYRPRPWEPTVPAPCPIVPVPLIRGGVCGCWAFKGRVGGPRCHHPIRVRPLHPPITPLRRAGLTPARGGSQHASSPVRRGARPKWSQRAAFLGVTGRVCSASRHHRAGIAPGSIRLPRPPVLRRLPIRLLALIHGRSGFTSVMVA